MFWLLPWHQQKTVTLASTQIKTVCSGHYPGINKTVTLASTQINTVCSGHYPGIYKRQLPWPQNKYSTFCYYPGINANIVHSGYYPGTTKDSYPGINTNKVSMIVIIMHANSLQTYPCINKRHLSNILALSIRAIYPKSYLCSYPRNLSDLCSYIHILLSYLCLFQRDNPCGC